MKTIEEEILFIIETHNKFKEKGGQETEFLRRINTLYLAGDLSENAYAVSRMMYAGAELSVTTSARAPARKVPTPTPTVSYSSCGTSVSRSSC